MMILAPLLLALSAAAAPPRIAVDDSDLSEPGVSIQAARELPLEGRRDGRALVFRLIQKNTTTTTTKTAGFVTGRTIPGASVRLSGAGAPETSTPVKDDGTFAISADGLSGTFTVRLSLDNPLWRMRSKSGDSYEWESPVLQLTGSGADAGTLSPEPGSANAKLAVLHATYLGARDFLAREGDLDWWTKTLEIRWPGEADFFSPWDYSLEITNPAAWDVVLHELGHAVMDGAMRAEHAGGSHKIDECYSPALAWSEGWATFFAAAVRLRRDDEDAKFEFLVPRRAPIRIENVPADVCQGQASEWRVAAGFWDLLDTHDDGGDHFSMPFSALWAPLRGQRMGSAADAWTLIAARLNPAERRAGEDALIHNTLLPARALPSAPSSLPAF
jgi:hypothetical protein